MTAGRLLALSVLPETGQMVNGGGALQTAIVVFTRDLRLHDNPALHQACARARQVLPPFVRDPAIKAGRGRRR
jgi:deoxyribodipyrimidine photolyase